MAVAASLVVLVVKSVAVSKMMSGFNQGRGTGPLSVLKVRALLLLLLALLVLLVLLLLVLVLVLVLVLALLALLVLLVLHRVLAVWSVDKKRLHCAAIGVVATPEWFFGCERVQRPPPCGHSCIKMRLRLRLRRRLGQSLNRVTSK